MNLIAAIESEIAWLEQARQLLIGEGNASPKRGRSAKHAAHSSDSRPTRKRKLSPEGLARIREAQKRRWADRKRMAKKSAPAATPE